MADGPDLYQLKVTLRHSKPPIWRRLLVASDTTLDDLHYAIQIAMGWENAHLHQFVADGVYHSDRRFGLDEVEDERRATLGQVAPEAGSAFLYDYDFGDGWKHDIVVEHVLDAEPSTFYPRCTGGRRACPPEDVGGVWGYDEFLDAIRSEDHPEHESYRAWAGDDFDPAAFDLDDVNEALRAFDWR